MNRKKKKNLATSLPEFYCLQFLHINIVVFPKNSPEFVPPLIKANNSKNKCNENLFSSVAQLCPTHCDSMDCSMPGFPVHHQLPEFAQTHVHWVGDATQPPHRLSSPAPPAFNLLQYQDLFQWVSSLHQVADVLELQFQHQSFQWIFRVDFL